MDLRSLLSLSLLATAQKQYAASDDVAQHSVRQPYVFDWQTGTATGQANKIYRRRGTLSAAGSLSFDLTNGSLHDPFGDSVAMGTVRAVCVANLNASGAGLLTLSSSIAGFPQGIVSAWGVLFGADQTGWDTLTGTAQSLTLTATAASVTFDLIVIGTQ